MKKKLPGLLLVLPLLISCGAGVKTNTYQTSYDPTIRPDVKSYGNKVTQKVFNSDYKETFDNSFKLSKFNSAKQGYYCHIDAKNENNPDNYSKRDINQNAIFACDNEAKKMFLKYGRTYNQERVKDDTIQTESYYINYFYIEKLDDEQDKTVRYAVNWEKPEEYVCSHKEALNYFEDVKKAMILILTETIIQPQFFESNIDNPGMPNQNEPVHWDYFVDNNVYTSTYIFNTDFDGVDANMAGHTEYTQIYQICFSEEKITFATIVECQSRITLKKGSAISIYLGDNLNIVSVEANIGDTATFDVKAYKYCELSTKDETIVTFPEGTLLPENTQNDN